MLTDSVSWDLESSCSVDHFNLRLQPGVRLRLLLDLVSYCGVRVQSNPVILKETACTKTCEVRLWWWRTRSKIEWGTGEASDRVMYGMSGLT